MTAEELIAFEADIAAEFNAGHIRAPIHLDGGNEAPLIKLFEEIKPTDWVLCSWRSHYKALLHGVPPARVKAEIMAGRSIALCFPEHRFLSSAIVGGTLPIAVGIALGIKRRGGEERVHVFLGEMTARTGAFHECLTYARGKKLPIRFIIEDNGLSVCTPTAEVWGEQSTPYSHIARYSYKLPFPHSGAGKRVEF
jgi:TPP-dependent pyruvate/acetoin dehydrogenase alpha subunit